MAGPGDQGAADVAGRGYLRASHADREHVIGMLKAAFVQGRLTKAELDARVGQAFASKTYGELAALTSDLPPGLITAPRPRQAARARARSPLAKVAAGAALIIPAPAFVVAAVMTGGDPLGKVALVVVFCSFMAWIVAGAQIIDGWLNERSRGQLPRRPARGGQALEGEQVSRPGTDLTLCQAHGGYPRPSSALA